MFLGHAAKLTGLHINSWMIIIILLQDVEQFHFTFCDTMLLMNLCSVDEVEGFDNLRWEHQVKVRAYVEGKTSTTQDEDNTDVSASGENGEYAIEVAKSSRATCKSCTEKIEKGQVCTLLNMYNGVK